MTKTGPPADSVKDRSQDTVRKKFANPPVKLACLSCRASRTRCDGGCPCASCVNKGNDCIYRPSRRGGPRVRKKTLSPRRTQPATDIDVLAESEAISQKPLEIQDYIDPGAGLKQLRDVSQDSDFIFDSLFTDLMPGVVYDDPPVIDTPLILPLAPMVRTYKSDYAILQAYYIWIHPYFPILPPPTDSRLADEVIPIVQNQPDDFGDDFEPSTPLTLALSAILALIPCPQDTNPLAPDSVVFRRKYAQFLAQSAIESIEIESEIPESSIEPPKALNESSENAFRAPFHPFVPIELESIVALDLLSVYEYAQRGNLKKMRSRATQAFSDAMMNFSLHALPESGGVHDEAKRRIWWMTFTCVCQASIVSNTAPSFDIFTPSFTTKYPTLELDPEAWPAFILSQRAILAATQLVMELNKALSSQADMGCIYNKMVEMENFIGPLVEKSEGWIVPGQLCPMVDHTEQVLARSLKSMARIKLNSARIKVHRYCAFFDLPVFSGKHCDLKSTVDKDINEPKRWPSCSCDSMSGATSSSGSSTSSSMSPSAVGDTPSDSAGKATSIPPNRRHGPANLPFTSHYSAKICLRSALNIARAFDSLPYPNPGQQSAQDMPCTLSATSSVVVPRAMPSFACCAMQCSYSLLMIHHKTKSIYPASDGSSFLVGSMLHRLQQGLTSILAALENYATAFEALGGMRDQIRLAVESSMVFDGT